MNNFDYTIDEIPPSLNRYLGNSHSHRIYGAEKVRWSWLVLAAVRENKPEKPLSKVEVHFKYYFKDKLRHDLDNIAGKFIADPLVKLKVIKDDNFQCITKIVIEGALDRTRPRTEINIIVLEE